MPDHNPQKRRKKPTARSRVTNEKQLHLDTAVDGRSRAARRYRDLYEAILSEITQDGPASEMERQLARRGAAIACLAEQSEGQLAAGKKVSINEYTSLTVSLSRIFEQLGFDAPKWRLPGDDSKMDLSRLDASDLDQLERIVQKAADKVPAGVSQSAEESVREFIDSLEEDNTQEGGEHGANNTN